MTSSFNENDLITVGLDFGTHQTKICVQIIPDEGHGQPRYEFFTFEDLFKEDMYFLPSVIQINDDDTLSYGFFDANREKMKELCPRENIVSSEPDFNIKELAEDLFLEYSTPTDCEEDLVILEEMLSIRKEILLTKQKAEAKAAHDLYVSQMEYYANNRNIYRYFKQATFAEREWNKPISSKLLCIWYLSYVIFKLEEVFGQNFGINMGIPADDKNFNIQKKAAVEVLLSAYNLVETVYDNNIESFLSESVVNLQEKTKVINYNPELKEEYRINIFPEAYAGLITLTSRGRLSKGISLIADIGGGTTDVSFFTISYNAKTKKEEPRIYRYWSIPRGLNYIAEKSGFDFATKDFSKNADRDIISKFNRKLLEIVGILLTESKQHLITKHPKLNSNFNKLLQQSHTLVYTGGGSTFDFLTKGVSCFSDIKLVNANMWKEEDMRDKKEVGELCQLLTTAYGLSLCESDEEVNLRPFSSLFGEINGGDNDQERHRGPIDKDVC